MTRRQETESFYENILAGLSRAVLITDSGGALVYISAAVGEVLGTGGEDPVLLERILTKLGVGGRGDVSAATPLPVHDRLVEAEDGGGTSRAYLVDIAEFGSGGTHLMISLRKATEAAEKSESLRRLSGTALSRQADENGQNHLNFVEHAPIAIFVIKDDAFIYTNEAWRQLTGYTEAESRLLDPFALVDPRMRDLARQRNRDRLAGKAIPVRYDLVIIDKAGRQRWVDFSVRRMICDGEPAVLGFAIDITERKRGQEELKDSQSRFKFILKHDPNAIAVFDRAMNYLAVSDRYLRDYRVPEADIIGKNHYEVFPETPQRWRACHRRALQGVVEGNEDDWFERVDGTVTYNRWECRPWYDQHGEIGGIVIYSEVITDRKLAELALTNSETRLRQLMDSTVEAIVGLDPSGVCTFINRSGVELLGYDSADEIVGRNMHRLTHHSWPDGSFYPESECVQVNALLAREPLYNNDMVYWRKDGSSFPVSCRLQPFDSGGQPAGGVLTFLDISAQINANLEKKRLEDQLRQSQKLESIGTLAGGIAHDFNNILGGIIGYGELIEMFDNEDVAEVRKKVGRILKAAYRAKDLVNQILAFSRKMEAESETVHLVALIRESLILLRASLPSTITIETSFTDGNDAIFADPTQIHQVLLNLCTNAADAMKQAGGTLTLTLAGKQAADIGEIHTDPPLKGAWLLLEVKDTGCGFSLQEANRIFEPYYTTKKAGHGTGLGLALVYGIVKAHGGHLAVSSEPGVGSSFRLYFPLHASGEETPERARSGRAAAGSGRILFVDDEQDLVSSGEELLATLGYGVTALTSSAEALARFTREPDSFDLVITDEIMPGLTGSELALKIRHLRDDIPIILCTGNIDAVSQEAVTAADIREVLRKPVGLTRLAHLVAQILKERS